MPVSIGEAQMTAPLSTSTPSPSVRTVMGSAIRITSGQTSALISPISAAPAARHRYRR